MNPDQATAGPDSIPQATLLDGLVICPHCRGWIEPSADHAGQTVACPHCNGHFRLPETVELGFDPASVPAPRGGSPPSPKEPWFYGFIDAYAKVWMWIALIAVTLYVLGTVAVSSIIAVASGGEHTWIAVLFLIANLAVLGFGLLSIVLSVAFMHLAVDIARTLRAIRLRQRDGRP
jgi:hypothetical protein